MYVHYYCGCGSVGNITPINTGLGKTLILCIRTLLCENMHVYVHCVYWYIPYMDVLWIIAGIVHDNVRDNC